MSKTRTSAISALAVAVVAVLMVSSLAPLQPEDVDEDLTYKSYKIESILGWNPLTSPIGGDEPDNTRLPVEDGGGLKPIEIRDDPSQIDDIPSIYELNRLYDLEGK